MPFAPVDRALDLVALEERVLAAWRANDVFHESLRRREGSPEWVFYEGPPTANGRPGIHHVLARSFKDLFPRFQTMRGRHVARKGGWDCHGLPVEVEVEKELGFSGKHQIEDFGIEEFNRRCRESVHRYVEDWSALTSRIGMWLDTADAYWTLTNEYIESVWWIFGQLWDKSLIYEGFKVVPYCGRCGTALSSHELGQPGAYRDVTEASVYVRFPLLDAELDLLVWTTTPWTLLSNVGVAIGPEVAYVRVRTGDGRRDVVMAAARVAEVLGDDVEVVETVPVDALVGRHYARPFDLVALPDHADALRVVADEFVTVEDGSGIVHLAPAFGEIDREIGEREGLPLLNPVGPAARFVDAVTPYAGQFVKEADADIIDALAAGGLLERVVDYTHSYPHCWRCGTPLIYWAKPTWFARTSARRDALLRENEAIGWHPEHIKHGRFGDWLENNVDWALSRDRFWGTPIPIWRCLDCGHDTCIGSVEELTRRAGRDLAALDLHRPFVDDVRIACEACDGAALRVEPVLDAWFDSGSMPSAQFHYPFEARDRFESRFPADFICEAIDQTRGWFYSLLAVNTLVFDRSPYRNVLCLGLLVAGDGQKMSKSKGNVTDPWTILTTRGADALRWHIFASGSPWTTRRFTEEGIDETTRRFLLTLWNTYSFFVTYANLDGWEPPTEPMSPVHVLDRWVRSRLSSTIVEVSDALEGFDALRGAQAIERFVDDLSNWYVRRSRARFWKSSEPAAHATLHECLTTVTQLLAPFCPFLADELWTNLTGGESVHLSDWPTPDLAAVDEGLEEEMAYARQVVSLGRAARTDAKLKVRQPLARAFVLLPRSLAPEIVAEVADELNVKTVELVTSLEGLLDYTVVPNFRTLGPRLGPRLPAIKDALTRLEGAEIQRLLDRDGSYTLTVEGEQISLGPDDLVVRAHAHDELALARDGATAVALDLALDHGLRLEGTARDLARALNDHRKAIGLEIADRIDLELWAPPPVAEAATHHAAWIAAEVLATTFGAREGQPPADAAKIDVNGAKVAVRIARV